MADIYGSSYYGPSYVTPTSRRSYYDYSGYHNSVPAGYRPAYSQHHHNLSRHDLHSHHDHVARRAWATEIPVQVWATICCEECRMRIETNLRHLEGVYDVGITGRGNAMVTVTGTAAPRKILQEIRLIAKDAELWTDDHSLSSHSSSGYRRHH